MTRLILILLFISSSLVYSQKVTEISRNWTSFSQSLDIATDKEIKFKLTASVKVVTKDSTAWAGLWVRVDNKDDESGFFDNMGDRPIKSSEWKEYSINGIINPNSKELFFGGLSLYDGDFYFDDFNLFFEDDKGVFQKVDISNASFENKMQSNSIKGWQNGISKKEVRIKEYNSTSSEDASEGKYSLLIQGKGTLPDKGSIIEPLEGFTPQIGTLVAMLNDLSDRVESIVGNMNTYQIDHLHDENANRIGALVMHLAAAEAFYQVYTFENRSFNEEEEKKWAIGLNLGKKAQEEYQGQPISYYLDIYKEVRKKTIEELKKRDDAWLNESNPGAGMNNHFGWFHVMEHQSSHLGQILFLRKRIPPKPEELNINLEMKN